MSSESNECRCDFCGGRIIPLDEQWGNSQYAAMRVGCRAIRALLSESRGAEG